jgi:hypothetical protein
VGFIRWHVIVYRYWHFIGYPAEAWATVPPHSKWLLDTLTYLSNSYRSYVSILQGTMREHSPYASACTCQDKFVCNKITRLSLVQILACNSTASSYSCPATRHGGAWGERRYSCYSFSTSALDGGEWSVSLFGRALPPGKGPPVPIGQEAGWAPEPVWTQRLEEKSFRLCRGSNFDRPVVQPVATHYTDWATRLTQ